MSRFLDLDEMLDRNEKIYVRNNSLRAGLFLVIQMTDKSGRKRALKIPTTRFPICVSTQFSKDVIRESSDLRDMLGKGNIVLVEASVAEKELSTVEAQEEAKALSLSVYADTAPANAVRDSVEALKHSTSPTVTAGDLLSKKSIQGEEVTAKVQGIVASLLSKEKTSKETLTNLKRLASTLTEADLTYIIKECSKETQIREFAEKTLSDLSGMPEQPFQE